MDVIEKAELILKLVVVAFAFYMVASYLIPIIPK